MSPTESVPTLQKLSIVIPIYNEAGVLAQLYQRLVELRQRLAQIEVEFVLVDDGSADDSWSILRELAGQDPSIRALSLSRNFGQQVAFSAGLEATTGDAVVLMDADLQDDPSVVVSLIQLYREGYDVVAVRRGERDAPVLLRLSYNMFYRLFQLLSPMKLTLDSGDFSLMSRRVVDALNSMPERHRFLRGLRSWVGFRHTSITVDRPRRHAGESKFTLSKLFGLATDGLLSFSTIPLRLVFVVGVGIVGLAVLMSLYSIYVKLTSNESPTGFTATIIFVTMLGGANLLSLGIMGEYIGRIYEQIKGRPLYLVKERLGLPERSAPCPTCGRSPQDR